MSEQVDVNGAVPAFDLKAAKAALTSSSTSSRISQLRTVDEKISHKSMHFQCCPGLQNAELLLTCLFSSSR